jgi:hypothetical protein
MSFSFLKEASRSVARSERMNADCTLAVQRRLEREKEVLLEAQI